MKALTGIAFAVGIILAGSDGSWFPWVNWLGVGILSLSVPMAGKITD